MKLHPFSVPYRALSQGTSVGVSIFFLLVTLSGTGAIPVLAGPVVAFVAALGVVATALWQVAYYRRFEYDLTDDEFEIASGVVSRRNREIPLRRVQNVDISRNVVQRLFDIAMLELETAGGGETEASLRYVGYDEAKRLQREIQQRKRRAEAGEDGAVEGGVAGAEDRETVLFELDTPDLLVLSVLSFDLRYASLLAFGPVLLPFVPGVAEIAVFGGLVLLAVLVVGLWILSAAVTFARYYDFRLSQVGDDLRYERGLVQRFDGSIPLSKVQALTVRENVLMRRFGYAALSVETAGYGPSQSPAGGSEAAVPLAARERLFDLAREIEPFEEPTLERPPKRARRRYGFRYGFVVALVVGLALVIRTLAVESLAGTPNWWLAPAALLVVVPLAAHLTWVNRGYDAGETHVVTRNGFWQRTTKVVAYDRVQTVIRTRTPFQRRRTLATVVVDTASSAGFGGRDARAVDLDADDATEFASVVADRLQERLGNRGAEPKQAE